MKRRELFKLLRLSPLAFVRLQIPIETNKPSKADINSWVEVAASDLRVQKIAKIRNIFDAESSSPLDLK